MDERRDNRSSDDIRRDIEGTRSDLQATVNALERKLSVGQIVDEVWDRFGGRSAISSTASSFGDTVRDHPVPLALMGLGVAWLAVERRNAGDSRRRGAIGTGTYERAEGRVGPYRGEAAHDTGHDTGSSKLEDAKAKATSAARKAKSGAATVKAGAAAAKETASAVTEATTRTASHARDRMRSSDDDEAMDGGDGGMRVRAARAAERAREEAEHRSRQAKRGFRSAMEEQPLPLGAVAFGLGLASGLSVPTTRLEDETMGGAADAMKDEARSMAQEVAEEAKAVAKDTIQATKEEADRQGVTDDLKESVREIAAEAKETARERSKDAMERTQQGGTDD